jgi:histidinol-phosphatase
MSIDLRHALSVARLAAQRAGAAIMQHFAQGIEVEYKADQSPVTLADRAAERVIRETILEAFPEHAIYGEEEGLVGTSDFLWLVDPLDGTKSFVRSNPVFAVLIALKIRGVLSVAVSLAPAFGSEAYAVRGGGAFVDGKRAQLAACAQLERASISTGNLKRMAASPMWTRMAGLVARVHRLRGYGDFLHYHLLISGKLDAVIESDVNILDIAPFVLMVEEAGGCFTDLLGQAIDESSTSVLAATAPIHAAVRAALKEFSA